MSETSAEGKELTVREYNEKTGEVTLVDNAGNITVVKILGPADSSQTNLSEEVGGRRKRKNKSKRKKSHKKSMRRRK
jgi:hypothetical protein